MWMTQLCEYPTTLLVQYLPLVKSNKKNLCSFCHMISQIVVLFWQSGPEVEVGGLDFRMMSSKMRVAFYYFQMKLELGFSNSTFMVVLDYIGNKTVKHFL